MRSDRGERDQGLDALRGLAIVAMVASHLAREVLVDPHPLWLRAFGSIAAPLFIALSGLLTAQTAACKQYPLGHYLRRGGIMVLLAATVDVLVWGLYPCMGCDVLYLIGAALPLTALFVRIPIGWQALVMAAVFLLPTALRPLLGYPEDVLALSLGRSPWELLQAAPMIVHQWLLCGWFPLLPWLGFSFLGVWLFGARGAAWLRSGGAALMALGLLLAWLAPIELVQRGGYTELFYPPTLAYLLAASGLVLAMFSLTRWPLLRENQPLVQLGRCPLLLYVVHLIVLHWALEPVVGEVDLASYLALYAALLLILIGLAGAVSLGKARSDRRLPLVLRLLLGS